MIPKSKLSPMMEHYRSVKESYPDCILMYRLGDFYEMFFDDAQKASKILDLTLTGRDCGLSERAPMCGVPYHAVDGYISKLVQAGCKVAICEQLSAVGDQKGMLKRDVVRVITSGTLTDEENLSPKQNNYLLSAVFDGKFAGFAWSDISTGEVKVTQILQSNAEDFILALGPGEIIAEENTEYDIFEFASVKSGKMVRPSRSYAPHFAYDEAVAGVARFYRIGNIMGLGIDDLPLALRALNGLLQYTETTQKRALQHMEFPKVVRYSQTMYLDYTTIKNLELIETLNGQGVKGSLLWVLDETKTNMGARLLRKWICEPLLKKNAIDARLNAVERLSDIKLRVKLAEELKPIRDIERIVGRIAYNTETPKDCLAIAESLKQIGHVKKCLSGETTALLRAIDDGLNPLDELCHLLEKAIYSPEKSLLLENDADALIADGYNAELDSYRSAKRNAKAWLRSYEAKEKEATGIKTLKVGFNRVFGYYIEVSKSFINQVPQNYIRRQTMTTGERYITEELKKMEDTVMHSDEKARELELRLYQEIKDVLFQKIESLKKNANAIAALDVLLSFAEISIKYKYVKPKINTKNNGIRIIGGRHPVVEALKKRSEFIPNDTVLDDNCNAMIITGPNMAGKSTYMRQVALIVLLAHIGCYVPAESAEISPVDRIFTRVGASDNLAFGQSTFMVEMNEVANILNNATRDSLLILDEIGRGTSTLDGLSIAWAILEFITLKIHAKTLFATHYHELSQLENKLPLLKNYHVLINESAEGITFLYRIARGSASKSFGIEVASLAGISQSITERAKTILNTLEGEHGQNFGEKVFDQLSEEAVPTNQIGFFAEEESYKEIIEAITEIDLNATTPLQALTILENLKLQIERRNHGKRRK